MPTLLSLLLLLSPAQADPTRLKKYIPDAHCGGATCIHGLRIDISLKREFVPDEFALLINGKLVADQCDPSLKAGPLSPKGVQLIDDHRGLTAVLYREWPKTVSVVILDRAGCRPGTETVFWQSPTLEPKYGVSFPNGKDCGPVCKTALLNVVKD